MKKVILFFISSIVSLNIVRASILNTDLNNYPTQQADNNITAVINNETTDKQFEDLKEYFKKNDIVLKVENIERNSENKITGINLTISKGGQQSSYNMSSNVPIQNLELGYKEGNIFIGSNDGPQITLGNSFSSFFNNLNQRDTQSRLDSLLQGNQFSFNGDEISKFLNKSNFDFDAIQQQFFSQFFNNNESPKSFSTPSPPQKSSGIPKYSFFNSKKLNKLIIIDGKEADFETLDKLARADQLKEVDNLKPATAISLYGDKAKDGAIIATTK